MSILPSTRLIKTRMLGVLASLSPVHLRCLAERWARNDSSGIVPRTLSRTTQQSRQMLPSMSQRSSHVPQGHGRSYSDGHWTSFWPARDNPCRHVSIFIVTTLTPNGVKEVVTVRASIFHCEIIAKNGSRRYLPEPTGSCRELETFRDILWLWGKLRWGGRPQRRSGERSHDITRALPIARESGRYDTISERSNRGAGRAGTPAHPEPFADQL